MSNVKNTELVETKYDPSLSIEELLKKAEAAKGNKEKFEFIARAAMLEAEETGYGCKEKFKVFYGKISEGCASFGVPFAQSITLVISLDDWDSKPLSPSYSFGGWGLETFESKL